MGLWVFSVEDIPQPQWTTFTETGIYMHTLCLLIYCSVMCLSVCMFLFALMLLNLVWSGSKQHSSYIISLTDGLPPSLAQRRVSMGERGGEGKGGSEGMRGMLGILP